MIMFLGGARRVGGRPRPGLSLGPSPGLRRVAGAANSICAALVLSLVLASANAYGPSFSSAGSSSRSLPSSWSAPSIVEQPSDVIVAEDAPATLTCQAVGEPPPKILWFKISKTKSAEPVSATASGSHRLQLPDGSLFFLRAKATDDAATFFCTATSDAGVAHSRNATLEIAYLEHDFPSDRRLPSSSPSDHPMASAPTVLEVLSGSSAELPCIAPAGRPEPVVRWRKSGRALDLSNGRDRRIAISAKGSLRIRDVEPADEDEYQCVAANIAATREARPVRLRVLSSPYFIRLPSNTSVLIGRDAALECSAGGTPEPEVAWSVDGKRVDAATVNSDDGVVTATLRLRKVHLTQAGVYVCTASNGVGKVKAGAELVVQRPPEMETHPPSAITQKAGQRIALRCSATGIPRPVLFWMHEEERTFLLPGDHTDVFEVSRDGELVVDEAASTMHLVCFAVNGVGSALARTVALVTEAGAGVKEVGVRTSNATGATAEAKREPLSGGVEITQLSAASATAIRVSWSLTISTDLQLVDGFYILHRQHPSPASASVSSSSGGFTSVTVLHAAATSYVVNRLLPYTRYEFVVIPFQRGSASGPGLPSSLHAAFTQEIRPTHAPVDLRWAQINASAVNISWLPLPVERFKGVPLGYRVLVLQHGQLASNVSLSPEQSWLMMSNLEPHHSYHVQVAAYNSQGTGPYSRLMQITPEPDMAPFGAWNDADPAYGDEGTSDASSSSSAGESGSLSSWLVPVVVCFAVLTGMVGAAIVCYARARTNSHLGKVEVANMFSLCDGEGRFRNAHRHSNGRSKKHRQRRYPLSDAHKELQLLSASPSGSAFCGEAASASSSASNRHKRSAASGLSSAETMYLERRFSGPPTSQHLLLASANAHGHDDHEEDDDEEEDSDYACLDRSTHSITGYLNTSSLPVRQNAMHQMHQQQQPVRPSVTEYTSPPVAGIFPSCPLSPYATTHFATPKNEADKNRKTSQQRSPPGRYMTLKNGFGFGSGPRQR